MSFINIDPQSLEAYKKYFLVVIIIVLAWHDYEMFLNYKQAMEARVNDKTELYQGYKEGFYRTNEFLQNQRYETPRHKDTIYVSDAGNSRTN